MLDYDKACADAIERQGLPPIIEALKARGIDHAVEQTGGFVMAISVKRPDGTWGLNAEGDHGVMLCWYRGDKWALGEEEAWYRTDLTIDEAIECILAHDTEGPK